MPSTDVDKSFLSEKMKIKFENKCVHIYSVWKSKQLFTHV